ncbi:hypothetical protein GGE24_004345 [Bradyrhizobium centrosematis]|nr:hypothetical protein [Bradyrhizobium centrosematis]MCS3775006.1 hypothetical protein [Bradyrhizobium centrosematis]
MAKGAIDRSDLIRLKHDPQQREAVVSAEQSLMVE